ncbi:M16 family metallopeptidase [Mucilaginibacter auburnensis]|uniref:Zinc protease n=1 Tax=Mucilaginibacter auburnensis TaxID=1457233 RepID=A0A2H9VW35_9SPHI|nr:insulinase family protein [Mucilaginibacter auburnensis]PJJ85027.1 zinc protease [Mucilaginibacter auburnensis]
MNIKKIFSAVLLTGLYSITYAQTLPFDPAVRTGKLANGFTYYIRHNEEPKNRVVFYLANKVGSVLEDDDQRGLAHFIEHMSFNGTKNFPKNELVDYLQKTGVRFGADLNATTGFDETIYQLPIPSDKPEIVQHGLQIMRDWAQDATLDPAEINKERGVVLEEKRLKKGAGERMQNQYLPLLLNNSIYAKRLPIGTEEVLTTFKPEAIQRFYRDWYRPDLQALMVVGDIDVDKMEKDIKSRFGDLKKPASPRIRPNFTVQLTGKDQYIVVTDPEETNTSIEINIKQPKLNLHTAADYRAFLIRQLVNYMLSQRYADVQRQSAPPFLAAGAGIGEFIGGLDNYSMSITAKPGELEAGFKNAWRLSEQAKRYGFTPTELDRAKNVYLQQLASVLKEKSKTPSDNYVAEYVQYFLHGTASPGIDIEYGISKNVSASLSTDEVNNYLKQVIKGTDRDILITAPEKEKASLPSEQTFMEWMKAVESEHISAFQDVTSKQGLLTAAPIAGKIINSEYNKALNITTLTLSNGAKVLLKATNFKNDQILFTGTSAGGTSLYDIAHFRAADAANIVPSFGAGNYNESELSKYLSGKQFSIRPSIGERTQAVNGASSVNDLEDALQLMYAYLTQPRKDTILFKNTIARAKAALLNRQNDPAQVFNDTVTAVLSSYNIRRARQTAEDLDHIELDQVYSIYKERFADASGFTFVFTGSIDTVAIKPLLEKYIGSLPSLYRNEQAKDLGITSPAGKVSKTVYKGTEDKANVLLFFSGPFDYSFTNQLKVDALKEILQIRLIERLREDEGGVYAPTVGVTYAKYPKARFNFTVSFACAPNNVEQLIAATLDEINKIRNTGPLPVNLDKFKAETQRTIELQLKSNGFWHTYTIGQIQNKEPLDAVNTYSEDVGKITVEDVKKMATQYLGGENFIRMVLLPEKTK